MDTTAASSEGKRSATAPGRERVAAAPAGLTTR